MVSVLLPGYDLRIRLPAKNEAVDISDTLRQSCIVAKRLLLGSAR